MLRISLLGLASPAREHERESEARKAVRRRGRTVHCRVSVLAYRIQLLVHADAHHSMALYKG